MVDAPTNTQDPAAAATPSGGQQPATPTTQSSVNDSVLDRIKGKFGEYSQAVQDAYEKDGKPNVEGFKKWLGAKKDVVLDDVNAAVKDGRDLYQVIAPKAEGMMEKVMGFVKDHMGAVGAGIAAVVLGMGMGEMGIIGALLLGALVFAAVGGMTGMFNGMMGGTDQKKDGDDKTNQKVRQHAVAKTHALAVDHEKDYSKVSVTAAKDITVGGKKYDIVLRGTMKGTDKGTDAINLTSAVLVDKADPKHEIPMDYLGSVHPLKKDGTITMDAQDPKYFALAAERALGKDAAEHPAAKAPAAATTAPAAAANPLLDEKGNLKGADANGNATVTVITPNKEQHRVTLHVDPVNPSSVIPTQVAPINKDGSVGNVVRIQQAPGNSIPAVSIDLTKPLAATSALAIAIVHANTATPGVAATPVAPNVSTPATPSKASEAPADKTKTPPPPAPNVTPVDAVKIAAAKAKADYDNIARGSYAFPDSASTFTFYVDKDGKRVNVAAQDPENPKPVTAPPGTMEVTATRVDNDSMTIDTARIAGSDGTFPTKRLVQGHGYVVKNDYTNITNASLAIKGGTDGTSVVHLDDPSNRAALTDDPKSVRHLAQAVVDGNNAQADQERRNAEALKQTQAYTAMQKSPKVTIVSQEQKTDHRGKPITYAVLDYTFANPNNHEIETIKGLRVELRPKTEGGIFSGSDMGTLTVHVPKNMGGGTVTIDNVAHDGGELLPHLLSNVPGKNSVATKSVFVAGMENQFPGVMLAKAPVQVSAPVAGMGAANPKDAVAVNRTH